MRDRVTTFRSGVCGTRADYVLARAILMALASFFLLADPSVSHIRVLALPTASTSRRSQRSTREPSILAVPSFRCRAAPAFVVCARPFVSAAPHRLPGYVKDSNSRDEACLLSP